MITDNFVSPTKGRLSINRVVTDLARFINEEPGFFYRLIIGSDSQERRLNGKKELTLVSAIVIHRMGKGGRYFYQKIKQENPKTLREKIYAETFLSLGLASRLLPKLNKILNGRRNYDLEIHIDVGKSGETRDMIKEVVGMVNGSGYKAKTKPDSYGATKVADKHT